MKVRILRVHTEGDTQITEYTRDGKTVSHEVRNPISTESDSVQIIEQPTMGEQILFETKYQTLLLETMALGGTN